MARIRQIMRPAVFLDLQGTLGGVGIDDVSTFAFYSFAPDAIRRINELGLPAIVVTNQSHIAKGLLTQGDFDRKMALLREELAAAGARLDAVYCCPHGREDDCLCKKPNTGMVDRAAAELGVDPGSSYMVGDMGASDMLLARNAGMKAVLVLTGVGRGSLSEYRNTWGGMEADHIAENVLDAVSWIAGDVTRTEQGREAPMLNKDDIIRIMNNLGLPAGEYWISTGAALVLHGVRETTHDIDIGCTTALFNRLLLREHEDRPPKGDGQRSMVLGGIVEVFENWAVDRVETVEGLTVASLEDIRAFKARKGREKDLRDIELIDRFLGR